MPEILVKANVGQEIAEISQDFTNPVEIVREAIHNAYDAGATLVELKATKDVTSDERVILTLEIQDNGLGMNVGELEQFFGLGFSKLPERGKRRIGYKGHGTKIYYQSQTIQLATKKKDQGVVVAVVESSRRAIVSKQPPKPEYWQGEQAIAVAEEKKLAVPIECGTFIRLIDYTPDSYLIVSAFTAENLENYLRWFTVFGSFEHIVKKTKPNQPLKLAVIGTDAISLDVQFGFNWPEKDKTKIAELKKLDERRPFNYFSKTLVFPDRTTSDVSKIDIAVSFEGKRARLDRDQKIRRQKASGTLYSEEERYGVWLCKDYIPVEFKKEWLDDPDCPKFYSDLGSPLILVNCEKFKLIANRNSVGNSSQFLLNSIKKEVFKILDECQRNKDVANFLKDYQEDIFERLREKDKKALQRRIDRYNRKALLKIVLTNGKTHKFWEPQREVTLFGLIVELQLLDPKILNFYILDYDDHMGIDLLVRRNGAPTGNLLEKPRVAYVELKYNLRTQINHAFDHLYAIVCWENELPEGDSVFDPLGNKLDYRERKGSDGITYSDLTPSPGSRYNQIIKVVVLKRLLQEKFKLTSRVNPEPIKR